VVISNLKTIKLLLDRTRADIVFKYLVNQEMTVKQLADAMGKKPGTVLHHVQKLKNSGIIKMVRTRETTRGIVERYYRAIAREYRLGITEMMRSRTSTSAPRNPVQSTLTGLSTLGIIITSTRITVLKSMNEFLLSKNSTYNELLAEWHDLLAQYMNGGQG